MSTNKNTQQAKQAKQAKKAKTQPRRNSKDPAMPSVETTPPDRSDPLVEVPEFMLDSLIERKMKEGDLGSIPEALCYGLHKIPRSMWPSPTPMELARLVVACGWAENYEGTKRAMDFLWESAFATWNSQVSAERWVSMIESEALNEVRQLAEDIGQDLTKLPDSISHSEFMGLFNTSPLTIAGQQISGQDLFDFWIKQPDATEFLDSDTLDQVRNDLPNFHANLKKHGVKAEDWSSTYAPYECDWLRLAETVRKFKIWRNKTAKENMATGMGNLLRGNKPPDAITPEAKPPGDTAPAGKTKQVKKTAKPKKAAQEDEITPARAKRMNRALDAALSSANSGKESSRKAKEKPKRQKRSRNPTKALEG